MKLPSMEPGMPTDIDKRSIIKGDQKSASQLDRLGFSQSWLNERPELWVMVETILENQSRDDGLHEGWKA